MPKWMSVSRSYRFMESELVPCRRGHWWPRCDVFFAALSLTFGIEFISYVPLFMSWYGGGFFLVSFALVLVVVAYPLMNIEMSLGQFGSAGIISIWNMCPLFKGIGYGMVLLSFMSLITESYKASWPLHYLATTILTPDTLPWTSCANPWNTQNCAALQLKGQEQNATLSTTPITSQYGYNVSMAFHNPREDMDKSPAEEYYKYRFLAQRNGTSIGNVGAIQWEILLSLAAFWVLMYLILIVGHYSLGKVAYFTTLVPLGIVIALLVKVIPLRGALDGLLHIFILTPKNLYVGGNMLLLTVTSHLSVIHGFLFGFGCFTMLGSYNRLKYNYHRDSILIVIFTFLFCALCIAMTSMYIGHFAYLRDVSIGQAMESGPKLLYVTLPSLLSSFEMPRLWLCLYFVLIFFLMFGTQMVITESIVTALADEYFPVRLTKGKRMLFKSLLTLAFCLLMLLIGIPFSTQGGNEISFLLMNNTERYAPHVLLLMACMVLIWLYGIVQYSYDVKVMLGYKPDYLILGCIIGVVPLTLLSCLAYIVMGNIIRGLRGEVDFNDTTVRPAWYGSVTWIIRVLPLTLVPIFMIVRLLQAAVCPQRCGPSKNYCERVVSPTIRWKRQYQQDVSERHTIIQRPTAPSSGRIDISSPVYTEIKETHA